MKNFFYLTFVLIITCSFNPTVSFSQIDASIMGTYKVEMPESSSATRTMKITSNKVTVFEGRKLVEKYFLYEKKGKDDYVIQKVELTVNTIDINEKVDRSLYTIHIQHLPQHQLKLEIKHPNGKKQLLTITKQ